MTRDLLEMADWLRERGLKRDMSPASTGKPVWNVLEEGSRCYW